MADIEYAFNERIFKDKAPKEYAEYAKLYRQLYEEGVGNGRLTEGSAREKAETIARRQFFAAAQRAGAASNTAQQQDTAPTPAAPRTRSLTSSQSRQIQSSTTPAIADELAMGDRNTARNKAATPTAAAKKAPVTEKKKNNNVLHNYTNYTYRLSLYTLKNSEFNKLVADPKSKVSAAFILSSGGTKFNLNDLYGKPTKDVKFNEDFYFEDLHLSTIIGLNSRSRETNAIDLTFTIFEPNGCTLIDKLIYITNGIAGEGEDNYLSMPYILQIDFMGYDKEGTPQIIPGITKKIPLTLIEMKIKPDLAGTRYSVRAVPFNHLALTSTVGVIPTNCEIKAETVSALFAASGSAAAYAAAVGEVANTTMSLRDQANVAAQEAMRTVPDEVPLAIRDRVRNEGLQQASENLKNPISAANSLSDALNGWNIFLVKEGIISEADEYNITFDPKIADSQVILPQLNPVQDVPTSSTKGQNGPEQRALQNSISKGIAQAAASTGVYRIFAGSTITNIISQVVRNSSFIRDQIKIEEANRAATDAANVAGQVGVAVATGGTGTIAASVASNVASNAVANAGRENQQNTVKEEEILKWFRIIPKVELLKFDKIRNQYAKKITFHVHVYKSPNPRYPLAPQGKATANDAVKNYDYWYTGNNTDVLSADIAFDTAFYTAVSLPSSAGFNGVNPNFNSENTENDEAAKAVKERQARLRKTGLPFPVVQFATRQLADIAAAKVGIDKKTMAVEDLAESLMSRSRGGDMVNLKLEIIGDPEFIKQDGIFGPIAYDASGKTINNSIITDHERVIVHFKFNYPEDWTQSEGLLKPKNPTVFTGLYSIIKVDSSFERGIFKQTLDMIKLHETQYDPPKVETINPLTGKTTVSGITNQIINSGA